MKAFPQFAAKRSAVADRRYRNAAEKSVKGLFAGRNGAALTGDGATTARFEIKLAGFSKKMAGDESAPGRFIPAQARNGSARDRAAVNLARFTASPARDGQNLAGFFPKKDSSATRLAGFIASPTWFSANRAIAKAKRASDAPSRTPFFLTKTT